MTEEKDRTTADGFTDGVDADAADSSDRSVVEDDVPQVVAGVDGNAVPVSGQGQEPESAEAGVSAMPDDMAAGDVAGAEYMALQQALEKERERHAAAQEKVLRIGAEIENLRRRTQKEVENAHKYALEDFVRELVPVLDSLEQGIGAGCGNEAAVELLQGMELTMRQLLDVMRKFGVEQEDPMDSKFDPERHQAIKTEQGDKPGHVVSVFQKGYVLNGRLVRPALVVVVAGGTESGTP